MVQQLSQSQKEITRNSFMPTKKTTTAKYLILLLPTGICQQPIEELKEEITNFKRQNPQSYIVVILHWGVEYQPFPTLVQRKGAHSLIRAGADAIIGHHPHIIQKEEYYDGKPIFYSLGNFVFDQHKPETTQSLIVQLNFTTTECNVQLHPVVINHCKPELQ
nr:CapA family protein [Bacteroides finegoldii]